MPRPAILILALAVALGAACAAVLLGTGGTDEPGPVVSWTAADEEPLPEEPDPEAGALGGQDDAGERIALEPAATPSNPDAPPPDVGLRGRVVDAGGRPVAGARVTLELRRFDRRRARRGAPGRARVRRPVVTQEDGVFAFHGKGARRMAVTLLVVHPAFAPSVVSRTFQNVEATTLDLGDVVVTEGGALLGSVVDETGAGVPDATVEIVPVGGHPLARVPDRKALLPPVRVEPSGGFLVPRLAPGDYRVRATAPRRLERWSPSVAVQDGRRTELEPLRLEPGCALHGIVLAADGKPLQGADVYVTVRGAGLRLQRDRTRRDGAFEIDHLPLRPLTVTVRKRGWVTVRLEEVDPRTASPLLVRLPEGLRIEGVVTDARTGAPVTSYAIRAVRVGNLPEDGPTRAERLRKLEAELRATRTRLESARRALEGKGERDPQHAASARKELQKLRSAERSLRQRYQRETARADRGRRRNADRPRVRRTRFFGQLGSVGKEEAHPEGRFVLSGLDQGVWAVEVSSTAHPRQRSEPVELRSGQPPARMVLRLQRGLAVRGVVRSAGGRPLGGARVELQEVVEESAASNSSGGGVRRLLSSLGPRGPRGVTVLTTRSEPDGSFVLRPAAPGRYMVSARGKDHGTATTAPFVVGSDVAGVELELPALATLKGQVRNVPADLRGQVRVVAFGGLRRMQIVEVEAGDRYELDRLEPGGYLVRAVAGDLRQFFFAQMRLAAGGGELRYDVTLAPGEVREMDLVAQVVRTSEVFGVVTRNGVPAQGLQVVLEDDVPPGTTPPVRLRLPRTRTDAAGAYRLRDVAEGRYRLRIDTAGRRSRTLHREVLYVGAGVKLRHDVSIATAVLEGRVRSDDGTPADQLDGVVRVYAGVGAKPTDERAFRRSGGQVFSARVRDGAFLLEDLPVGGHLLVLALRGREERTRPITAMAGRQVVELTAPRGRTAPAGPKGGARSGAKGKSGKRAAKKGR